MAKHAENKTQMAKRLGISRSSLYYQPKRPIIDEEVKNQIEAVLAEHPAYGHKRIAMVLKLNKKRILRVMKKYKITPYRKPAKKPTKKNDLGKPATKYTNLIEDLDLKTLKPDEVWCCDFTYIKHRSRFIYLATMVDLCTREVVGFNISRYHNRFLVIGALLAALSSEDHHKPAIVHSDQGSEYDSKDFTSLVERMDIKLSMSRKASPWENGYQESFFGHFKSECGDLSRFESFGELVEYIYQPLYYYNNERIHTKLKMSPKQYRVLYLSKLSEGGFIHKLS